MTTVPHGVPEIGSIVHLKYAGLKRKAVAYTITDYIEFEPGEWVFKAVSDRGVGITDGIQTLLG